MCDQSPAKRARGAGMVLSMYRDEGRGLVRGNKQEELCMVASQWNMVPCCDIQRGYLSPVGKSTSGIVAGTTTVRCNQL